jgi:SsrA-binding protein
VSTSGSKLITENRRARHDYHLLERVEAGVQLTGTEVKSLRKGQANIAESYAASEEGGLWLINAYIPEYPGAGPFFQHEPRRKRKLLLHRREIDRLVGKIREKSYTLVPLSLYEKKGRVKAELALVHGKQSWDKREDTKKRESQREIDRAMASRRR